MTIILRGFSDQLFSETEMLFYSLYAEGDLSVERLYDDSHCTLQGPIPVFTIAETDETRSDWTKYAEFTCWRFILLIDRSPSSIFDVSYPNAINETQNGPMLTQIETGPVVGALCKALLAAEDEFHSRKEEYELRILNIPFAHEQSLWLLGRHSFFIPFQRDLGKTPHLSALEFFKSLKVTNTTPD